MRLIWIRNSSKAVRRGQKSVNRPNEQFNTQGHSLSFFLGFRISAPVHLVLLELRIEWTKLLGIYFTLLRTVINLRIKTHTTKNIINNWLLLWRRGVNGVRPLLQPTLLREERSGFRTLFNPSLPSLVPCNRLYAETISQNMQENTPPLYHPVLWFQEIRMFT